MQLSSVHESRQPRHDAHVQNREMRKTVATVDPAKPISTSNNGTRSTAASRELGAGAAVFANFRQYLTGWGTQGRAGSTVDQFRSGLATPQFNGVVRVRSVSADGADTTAVRKEFASVPWWWWVGPDSPEDTADVLRRRGGRELTALPVMVLPLGEPADPGTVPHTVRTGVRVEPVRDDERLAEFVGTYRASMGVDPALEAEMVRIESGREDNADIIRLAAVLNGRVVGTTVVITAHGVAGIFLVHVTEAHRRRGVGAALTAAALQVGRERGTRCAALVASPAGEPLYRRFGFTTTSEYRLFAFPA
ncbi:GNAT superfamily N-acetyltransferase [Streptomyces sp. SAI-117]|nr:GNAT superfamily N-acetyltransferase [Streptomyces sp. SAI-041]MDH6572857.1 GNAT superfamily N-acetyltransferase [Streptomyces sp. SAI-117]MDH6582181.1 GNAT superfamily N-acetyltransferase [Streptomyces sp. SAI-133]